MAELVRSNVDKGNALLSNMASPSQCLQVLETCIRAVPNGCVHEDRLSGVIRVTSLLADYAQGTAKP